MAERTLTTRLDAIEMGMRSLRNTVQRAHDLSAAGQANTELLRSALADLREARARMAMIPRTQRVADLATIEWAYAGNLAADWSAIETGLNDLGDWMAARDSTIWNGYSIDDITWVETIPTFTAAATAGFRTEASALVAAIDTFLGNIS